MDTPLYLVTQAAGFAGSHLVRGLRDNGIAARLLNVPAPWIRLPVKPLQWLGSTCKAICVPLGIPPPLYRRRVDFYTKDRSFNVQKARGWW